MQYLLVENKQIIHLGPIFWRHRFIQSELEDLNVDYIVSPAEPNAYVKINDSFEIYPATVETPPHDGMYQQLAGPNWVFESDVATGTYTIVDRDLNSVKADLKTLAASERYKKEVAGIKLTIQGTEVSVATNRDSKNNYAQQVLAMSDADTVQWKFAEAWLTLSKAEMASLLADVNTHVQTQFDWERNIADQIDSATDADTLKNITIVETPNNGPL